MLKVQIKYYYRNTDYTDDISTTNLKAEIMTVLFEVTFKYLLLI